MFAPPLTLYFGLVVCVSSPIGSHLWPWCILFSLFFCCSNCLPNDGKASHHALQPPRATSTTSLLPRSLIAGCGCCCVFPLSFDHLRPTPLPPFQFLMCLCRAPRIGETTALSANLALNALHGYFRSRGIMSWGALLTYPWRERA